MPRPKKTEPSSDSVYNPEAATAAALPSIPLDEHMSVDEAIAPVREPVAAVTNDVERVRELRRQRRSQFGSLQQKLALAQRAGYHRHWFNDVPGRVDDAVANGWAHVTDKEGKPVKRTVGSGRDGGALIAYAMEIPSQFWEEDQAALHQIARDRMDSLKGGGAFRSAPGQAQAADKDKFYSPRDEPMDIRSPG